MYLERDIAGVPEKDIYDKAIGLGHNILLFGPTGTGKSSSPKHYADSTGKDYYSFSCNSDVELSHLFGSYILDSDRRLLWVDGPITRMVRNGGVLVVEELNFLNSQLSEALFSLLDERRSIILLDKGGEVVQAHKELLVTATMNEGYIGALDLNEALLDRFHIKLGFDYDSALEAKLIGSGTLRSIALTIREQVESGDMYTNISTRSLITFESIARDYGLMFAVGSLVNSFKPEERDAVTLLLTTHLDAIREDLSL